MPYEVVATRYAGYFGAFRQDENIYVLKDTPLEVMWRIDPNDKDYINVTRSNIEIKKGWEDGLELIGTTMQRNVLQRLWRLSLIFIARKTKNYSFLQIKNNLKRVFPQTRSTLNNVYWQVLDTNKYQELINAKSFVIPTSQYYTPPIDDITDGIQPPSFPPSPPSQQSQFLPLKFDFTQYLLPISIGIAGVIIVLTFLKRSKK